MEGGGDVAPVARDEGDVADSRAVQVAYEPGGVRAEAVAQGGVSSAITRGAHCPVLVVPRGVSEPFGAPPRQ